MRGELEVEPFGVGLEEGSQRLPVAAASSHERRKLLQLLAADGGLRIGRLEVVAEVSVDVLVVVTLRQFAELPTEPLIAGVVLSAGTPAVAAPVAETLDQELESGVLHDIDRAPLAHRDVVCRIKTQCTNIAKCACELSVISRS